MTAKSEKGYFINGKAQAIEMLQYMTPEEREKILSIIKTRNPQLASELMEKSISFANITQIQDEDFRYIFHFITAPIMGMAIKTLPKETQRKILKLAPRNYAEEAFKVMTTALSNEADKIKRSQEKVASLMGTLIKRGQITFH